MGNNNRGKGRIGSLLRSIKEEDNNREAELTWNLAEEKYTELKEAALRDGVACMDISTSDIPSQEGIGEHGYRAYAIRLDLAAELKNKGILGQAVSSREDLMEGFELYSKTAVIPSSGAEAGSVKPIDQDELKDELKDETVGGIEQKNEPEKTSKKNVLKDLKSMAKMAMVREASEIKRKVNSERDIARDVM